MIINRQSLEEKSLKLLLLFFLLDVNFDKSTIKLNFLILFSILAKFQEDQRSIATLSIECLNFKFL